MGTISARFDNWKNAITGLGHAMRDKVKHTEFSSSHLLSDEVLEALYHGDDIAARVCDLLPDEMLRQGFSIQITGETSDESKINAETHKIVAELKLREKLNEALVWARLFGGSALFVGVDDGQNPALPLRLKNAKAIRFVTSLDKRDLQPSTWYGDPLEPKYGDVQTYRVLSQQANTLSSEVHESRLLVFHGTRTSKRRLMQNNGWSISVLQRMYDVMQQFNVSWQATAHLMSDSAQAVFKLKGLHSQIASNKTSELLRRMELLDMGRSVSRAVLLDAEDEDFRRDNYQFGGIPDILDKMMLRLAAAARLPVSLLMGQAPAGLNATGDTDIRFFYDQVKTQQENILRPALERFLHILFACKEGPAKGTTADFTISFPALWQQTEREKAEIRKIQAEIDATYIGQGVLLPEEVAINRFSATGSSVETSINLDVRRSILEADRAQATEAD